MALFMKIDDGVDGKQGSVYITVDNKVKELPGVQKIEAKDSIAERTMKTVGTVKTQSAAAGVEGSGSLTIHYWAIMIFSEMVATYRKTGVMPTFDLLIINNDPATSLGRRSTAFTDCCLSGDVPQALLDATTDDHLTIDIEFKYSDCSIQDEFSEPAAVGRE